jgi:hypothetical protein
VEDERFGGLVLKTIVQAGFPVWALKPGVHPVRPDGGDGGHVASSEILRRGKVKL